MLRKIFAWGFLALLGIFLIIGLYDRFVVSRILNSYEQTLQQLEHPQGTNFIDAFKLKFSYYPATYVDESIEWQCAYLVGEIRGYTKDWDEMIAFYQRQTLLHENTDEIYIGQLPIKVPTESGVPPSFDMDEDFSYSPLDVDVLAKLESNYYFWGFPKRVVESGSDIYAVYIAPDCE